MPRAPRSSFFCCLFAAAFVCAASTPAQDTSDTVLHLHGTVRDGVTNKPIGHALVTSIDHRLAAMTDSTGHFSIDVAVPPRQPGAATLGSASSIMGGPLGTVMNLVPGGQLALAAQRPGYLPSDQQVQVALDESLNTTDVTLALMPAAAVSGHVTASGADSPQGVRISLLRHSVTDGMYQWLPVGLHTAGSTGEFRFTNLQPGEYTVMTAEWAGADPLPQQDREITQQYPPDFLGDTRTLTSAAKLRLHYGSEERADLHLRTATYYPVIVPVQNQPPNSPINFHVAGADAMNGYRLAWVARDSAVEGALPSGQYTLLLNSFGPQQGSASVPITVSNQPLQHAPVALVAGGRIPIRVHMEFAQTTQNSGLGPGENVQLYLRPLDGNGAFGGSSVRHNDDAGAALENVQPGTYYVHAQPMRGYVSSMTSGGVDLLRHPLTIGDGGAADPIDVTLRDDGSTVTGTVDFGSADRNAIQFASLLLVANDGSGNAIQGLARSDGKFTLQNVPPGSYRLFALSGSRMLQVPYRDAQAMRAMAGKGAAVTVEAGQTATADVKVTDAAEMDHE